MEPGKLETTAFISLCSALLCSALLCSALCSPDGGAPITFGETHGELDDSLMGRGRRRRW